MATSANALVLFVSVASDAPASSVATGLRRRPRLARPKNDGGNDASADNQRTDALDANRALRSRGADHRRAAGLPRRLATAQRRMHNPAQYPLGPGAARPISLVAGENPAGMNRRGYLSIPSRVEVIRVAPENLPIDGDFRIMFMLGMIQNLPALIGGEVGSHLGNVVSAKTQRSRREAQNGRRSLGSPVAFGLRLVADLPNDDLGVERQVVERQVEALGVGTCPESANWLPALLPADLGHGIDAVRLAGLGCLVRHDLSFRL